MQFRKTWEWWEVRCNDLFSKHRVAERTGAEVRWRHRRRWLELCRRSARWWPRRRRTDGRYGATSWPSTSPTTTTNTIRSTPTTMRPFLRLFPRRRPPRPPIINNRPHVRIMLLLLLWFSLIPNSTLLADGILIIECFVGASHPHFVTKPDKQFTVSTTLRNYVSFERKFSARVYQSASNNLFDMNRKIKYPVKISY